MVMQDFLLILTDKDFPGAQQLIKPILSIRDQRFKFIGDILPLGKPDLELDIHPKIFSIEMCQKKTPHIFHEDLSYKFKKSLLRQLERKHLIPMDEVPDDA